MWGPAAAAFSCFRFWVRPLCGPYAVLCVRCASLSFALARLVYARGAPIFKRPPNESERDRDTFAQLVFLNVCVCCARRIHTQASFAPHNTQLLLLPPPSCAKLCKWGGGRRTAPNRGARCVVCVRACVYDWVGDDQAPQLFCACSRSTCVRSCALSGSSCAPLSLSTGFICSPDPPPLPHGLARHQLAPRYWSPERHQHCAAKLCSVSIKISNTSTHLI